VITTSVGAIPELVAHNTTGLIAKERNVNSLSDAILRLLTEGSLQAKLSTNASKHVKTHFTEQQMALSVGSAYQMTMSANYAQNTTR
jgi:glycosyltransferase involved in cell wall biosynthesis